MLSAEPSPTPSPIDVHVTGSFPPVTVSLPPVNIPPPTVLPDPTLDYATIALAVFTAVLAVFTIALVLIGIRALRLQGQEIRHTAAQLALGEDQLNLTRDQFDHARVQARPVLDFDVGQLIPLTGTLKYINGSEPAHELQVWARTPGGYYGGSAGTLTASQPTFTFQLPAGVPALGNIDDVDWPFPSVVPLGDLADNESWIGATWSVPGGPNGRFLTHRRVDGTRVVRRDDDAQ